MLFGRVGCRALLSVGVAVGIGGGGAGGLVIADAQAANVMPPEVASAGMIVLVQSVPPTSSSTAPAAPGKEPQPKPKTKEKQRRLSPCGPGLSPCADAK
jgi:hypothetical protein